MNTLTSNFSVLKSSQLSSVKWLKTGLRSSSNERKPFSPGVVRASHHKKFNFFGSKPKPLNRDVSAKAFEELPEFKGYPPMQSEPEWWWRAFAVIPYIIPACEGWFYAHPAFFVFPWHLHYSVSTYPILMFLSMLPGWFMLVYFLTCFIGIVRNNRWPHFVRSHYIMAILLELMLQVVGTASNWFPRFFSYSKMGMFLWAFVEVTYFLTVLACLGCAAKGMYADIPFVSDAAYLQIPYE